MGEGRSTDKCADCGHMSGSHTSGGCVVPSCNCPNFDPPAPQPSQRIANEDGEPCVQCQGETWHVPGCPAVEGASDWEALFRALEIQHKAALAELAGLPTPNSIQDGELKVSPLQLDVICIALRDAGEWNLADALREKANRDAK